MMGPLISIIVPVYNTEKYLQESVDSLLAQTYDNIEIILVNDGSTDGSGSICERYARNATDKKIRYIRKHNGGAGSARNEGLKTARGEYIYFCDSDDTIRNDTLEKAVETAVENDADVVMFGAMTVDEAGMAVENDPYGKKYDYSNIFDPKALFAEMKKNDEYSCCVPFMLLRKSVIRFRFIKTTHEDELFTPQILYTARKIVYLPDKFYIRKIRDNSVTTTRKSAKNYIAMIHVIAGLERIEGRDSVLVSHICDLYRTINVMYSRLDDKDRIEVKEYRKRIDRHFIRMMMGAETGYRKLYRHAVLSKIYHAGKY